MKPCLYCGRDTKHRSEICTKCASATAGDHGEDCYDEESDPDSIHQDRDAVLRGDGSSISKRWNGKPMR